ncbi:hypothetical protein F5Y16DRAFT_367146 [Xylariaceae sp. FL0255]|nr:hypothetical protein F5Y16DRAFT_367146 [Xylariaceae sp. FL0255]
MSQTIETNNLVSQYGDYLTANKFVFTVFYRGHWCPFCQQYLHTLEQLQKAVAAEGGKVLAITAESGEHLQAKRDASGYTGEVIVDTENKIAAELRLRKLLDVAITEKKGYPHGMAQPAFITHDSERKIYDSWAIVPSVMNLGGAKDRPDLKQVWDNVEAQLHGRPKVHQKYSLQTFTRMILKKLFG